MQYILMIHDDESKWANYTEAEAGEIMGGYKRFTDYLVENNHMRSGERLQPSHTATTVRVRDGNVALTDGPYSETKEQMGGFYIVEAADLDEANKLAAMIPGAATGAIEVRPVWLMEDS